MTFKFKIYKISLSLKSYAYTIFDGHLTILRADDISGTISNYHNILYRSFIIVFDKSILYGNSWKNMINDIHCVI